MPHFSLKYCSWKGIIEIFSTRKKQNLRRVDPSLKSSPQAAPGCCIIQVHGSTFRAHAILYLKSDARIPDSPRFGGVAVDEVDSAPHEQKVSTDSKERQAG